MCDCEVLFVLALTALRALQPRRTSFSVRSAATMVTDELTVPCNSLSNLYSNGPSVFLFLHVIAHHGYYSAIYSYSYAANYPLL